jgi:hypothetical protein
MKDRFDNTPMVCSLTTVEVREREATLLAQFRSAIIETKELQEGYPFRLPGGLGENSAVVLGALAVSSTCKVIVLLGRYASNLIFRPRSGTPTSREARYSRTWSRSPAKVN